MELKFNQITRYTNKPPLGPVKTICTERIDFSLDTSGNWGESSQRPEEEITLDIFGRIIELTLYYHFEDCSKSRYTNHFNENGQLIESVAYTSQDEINFRAIYKYDCNGNRESIAYNKDNTIIEKSSCVYDVKKRLVKALFFYPNDALKSQSTSVYDDNGSYMIKSSSFNPDGTIQVTSEECFDSNRKVKETLTIRDGLPLLKTVSCFNALGNETDRMFYRADGSLSGKAIYDEQGEVVKHIFMTKAGEHIEETTYNYEYDVCNNWVKKILIQTVLEPNKMPFQRRMDLNRTLTYWDEA